METWYALCRRDPSRSRIRPRKSIPSFYVDFVLSTFSTESHGSLSLFKMLHRVCIRIIYQKCSSVFYTKLNIRWRLLFRRVTVDCSFENDTERFFLTYWCLSRRSTGEISQSKSICINVFTWNGFHWQAKLAQPLETSILYEHTQFPYDPSKWTFGYIKFISHRYSVSRESLFQVRRHLWMLACSLGYTVKSFLQNL